MPDRLLDTNAVAAAMKSDPALAQYLKRVEGDEQILLSATVEGEIRFGIELLPQGRRKRALSKAFAEIMNSTDGVLAVTRSTAREYSSMKVDLWRRGKPMDENDMWIAATALEHGLSLVSNDAAFHNVPRLVVESWLDA